MSLYAIDKVLRELIMDEAAMAAFVADAASYLAGRDLTDVERTALLERDYRTLYDLGAHPYMLWTCLRALPDGAPTQQEYVDAILPLGARDFGT